MLAECTKLARHSMETIEVKEIAPFTFAVVCICNKTAVSHSIPAMLKLLDRKHR